MRLPLGRQGGALAALAIAGLGYLWKNRKQASQTMQQFGQKVQGQLQAPQDTKRTTADEPKAYVGETTRI